MKKLWILALKEVRLAFRDVGMLVTMLATPLLLTLAIGAAFGGSSGGNLSDVPVLLLNHDNGTLSQALVDVFNSESVKGLIALEQVSDESAARARVDRDEVAVLIIIPADFSARVFPEGAQVQQTVGLDLTAMDEADYQALTNEQKMGIGRVFAPSQGQAATDAVSIELYASPDWRISTAIVKSVVTQGIEVMNIQLRGMMAIMTRLVIAQMSGGANPESLLSAGTFAAMPSGNPQASDLPVRLTVTAPGGRSFNWLDYSSASLAIIFLMFAVTSGGRTLLAEREWGTLPRLLITPTAPLAVLVGKMAGIVLTGLLQVTVLWGATSLLGAYWGNPLLVPLALLVLVICATGVGAVVSAWAQTAGQAGAIGTAVTLVGSAISGSFFPRMNLPAWVQQLSLVTPQAWGIEIFSELQSGGGLADLLPLLGGALLLTAVYYALALVGFRRQFR
ncbi:MAG: ABC transporter permease [Anaerolineae bacterium]|jgi:ABC-2 type transport system permease protein|nr:ABC transporter permease [Anaerolineae bacterium]